MSHEKLKIYICKIMDIPKNVEDVELYCDRVVSQLEEWSWLYEYRATEILLSELLSSESLKLMENLDHQSLSQVPLGLIQSNWPQQLRFFVEESVRLTLKIPERQNQPVKLTVPNKLRKCTSMKKQHEIDGLAPYILEHCLQSSISRIYDIGSGLGYIDRILATFGGFSVVGVELDSCKIEGAIKLNKELLEQNLSSNIIYIACRLDEENLEQICEQLQCYKENGCLVGLHACGDLSAVSLRLFLKMNSIKSLILMPCCYHKMVKMNSFPLSTVLKKKLDRKRVIINTNLLRIASECTRERWCNQTEDLHKAHAFHVLARAIVEKFLSDYGYKADRKGRKCVSKQYRLSWTDYTSSWVDRHTVVAAEDGTLVSSKLVHAQLVTYWPKYCHLVKRVIAYTCLQMCLQGVAESLLLIDKLSYLTESGQFTVSAIRVTDPAVSPRSVAIVADKQ